MIKRHHKILAGILIAQIIVGVFVFWPRSSAVTAGKPAFPDLKADDVVGLTIADGDGNTVQLAKSDGEWVLPNADDYPARGQTVDSFLKKVAELSAGQPVARSEVSYKRLKVSPEEFVRKVDIETSGTTHTLYVGSSPRFGAAHFRLEGQQETYLTNDLSKRGVGAGAASWIDPSYLSVQQKNLDKVTLTNANGEFVFEKGEEGNWTLADLSEDEMLNQSQVTRLLGRAARVSMSAPLGKEEKASYGLDDPSAVVAMENVTKTVTLRVGAKMDDGGYAVKSSESPYYVEVAETRIKSLVESAREDFIKKPATPTPSSGG